MARAANGSNVTRPHSRLNRAPSRKPDIRAYREGEASVTFRTLVHPFCETVIQRLDARMGSSI